MSAKTASFCVVVPMYNEAPNAAACVRAIVAELRKFPHRAAIIAVDDGSDDATGALLAQLAAEYPELLLVSHRGNRGYGAASASGVARAQAEGFDYVLFMDSDLTNHPRYIGNFIAEMDKGTDVIKASRYIPGGGMKGVPLHRAWISILGNKIAQALIRVPLRDCTNGFRAARVALLASIPLREAGFAAIMEELYYLKWIARSFSEVPYTLTSRGRHRPSKFRYQPRVFWQYLRYPLKAALGLRPSVALIDHQELANNAKDSRTALG